MKKFTIGLFSIPLLLAIGSSSGRFMKTPTKTNQFATDLKSLEGFRQRKAFLFLLASAVLALAANTSGADLNLVTPGTASGSGYLWANLNIEGPATILPFNAFPLYGELTSVSFTDQTYPTVPDADIQGETEALITTWTVDGVQYADETALNLEPTNYVPAQSGSPAPYFGLGYFGCFQPGPSDVVQHIFVGTGDFPNGPCITVTNTSYLNLPRPFQVSLVTYYSFYDLTPVLVANSPPDYEFTLSGGGPVGGSRYVTVYMPIAKTSPLNQAIQYQNIRPKKTRFIIRSRTGGGGVRG